MVAWPLRPQPPHVSDRPGGSRTRHTCHKAGQEEVRSSSPRTGPPRASEANPLPLPPQTQYGKSTTLLRPRGHSHTPAKRRRVDLHAQALSHCCPELQCELRTLSEVRSVGVPNRATQHATNAQATSAVEVDDKGLGFRPPGGPVHHGGKVGKPAGGRQGAL